MPKHRSFEETVVERLPLAKERTALLLLIDAWLREDRSRHVVPIPQVLEAVAKDTGTIRLRLDRDEFIRSELTHQIVNAGHDQIAGYVALWKRT